MSANKLLGYLFLEERKNLQSEQATRKPNELAHSARSVRPSTSSTLSLKSQLNKHIFQNQQKELKLSTLVSVYNSSSQFPAKPSRSEQCLTDKITSIRNKIEEEQFTKEQLVHMIRVLKKQIIHCKLKRDSVLKDTQRLSVYTPSLMNVREKYLNALGKAENSRTNSEKTFAKSYQTRVDALDVKKKNLKAIRSEIELLNRKMTQKELEQLSLQNKYLDKVKHIKETLKAHEYTQIEMKIDQEFVTNAQAEIDHLKEIVCPILKKPPEEVSLNDISRHYVQINSQQNLLETQVTNLKFEEEMLKEELRKLKGEFKEIQANTSNYQYFNSLKARLEALNMKENTSTSALVSLASESSVEMNEYCDKIELTLINTCTGIQNLLDLSKTIFNNIKTEQYEQVFVSQKFIDSLYMRHRNHMLSPNNAANGDKSKKQSSAQSMNTSFAATQVRPLPILSKKKIKSIFLKQFPKKDPSKLFKALDKLKFIKLKVSKKPLEDYLLSIKNSKDQCIDQISNDLRPFYSFLSNSYYSKAADNIRELESLFDNIKNLSGNEVVSFESDSFAQVTLPPKPAKEYKCPYKIHSRTVMKAQASSTPKAMVVLPGEIRKDIQFIRRSLKYLSRQTFSSN